MHWHIQLNPNTTYTSKTGGKPLNLWSPFAHILLLDVIKTGATEVVWCTRALLHGVEEQCLSTECSLIHTKLGFTAVSSYLDKNLLSVLSM